MPSWQIRLLVMVIWTALQLAVAEDSMLLYGRSEWELANGLVVVVEARPLRCASSASPTALHQPSEWEQITVFSPHDL